MDAGTHGRMLKERLFQNRNAPGLLSVTKLLSQSKGERQKPGDLLGAAGLSTATTPFVQEGFGPGSAPVSCDMLQSFPGLTISHCWLNLAPLETQERS